jgi:hypothetical protein
LSDDDHELFPTGDPSVEQIPRQHRIVLGRKWDHHRRIF